MENWEYIWLEALQEALVGLAALHREADPHHPPVLPIKAIAMAANLLIDHENQDEDVDDESDGDEQRRDDQHRIKARKIGSILRKQLHLRTERSGQHNGAFVAMWDGTRIDALRRRFGIDEEMEIGIVGVLRSRFLAEAGE